MRTTVDLADHLLVRAKKLAAEGHTTLTAVLEDSLRMYLAAASSPAPKRQGKFRLPVAGRGKPVRGVNLDDTSTLMDL